MRPAEREALPGATLAWLLAALALALAPHLARLPLWASGLAVLIGISRWLLHRAGRPLPPRLVVLLLTLACAAGVAVSYGTLLGRGAGVALLSTMLACKLLETHTARDTLLVIALGYFLVTTNLLFSQELPLALYLLVAVVALTGALIELTRPAGAWRINLRLAGRMLVQALPITLVVFLLFPRVPTPLWGLPRDVTSGLSGLSNELRMGAISQLSLSDAVAFRVRFDGPPPPRAQRYWRGPVLWRTDGRRWSQGIFGEARARPGSAAGLQPQGPPADYVVTLEPHGKRWLFALDLPGAVEAEGYFTEDFQYLARHPVVDVRRYRARSYPDYSTAGETRWVLHRALQLPAEVSPRVRELAERWRAAAEPAAVVAAALEHFRREPFVYTLNPPLLGADPVDEFLFESRRGFCEHYAASFVTLMRLAGIPARIVTGYLGGELNPLGDYLIVRQADAHAWAEVWLGDRGWVRVDPTAAVAPERIERSIAPLDAAVGAPVQFQVDVPEGLLRYLRSVRNGWDALRNGWIEWVIGYGPEMQRRLLSAVGMGGMDWRGMTATLTVAVSLLLGAVAFSLLRAPGRREDPTTRLYRRFCRKLTRHGFDRRAHEGPLDFAARVGKSRPELRPKVELITDLYVALRYGARTQPALLEQLRRSVQAFRP